MGAHYTTFIELGKIWGPRWTRVVKSETALLAKSAAFIKIVSCESMHSIMAV